MSTQIWLAGALVVAAAVAHAGALPFSAQVHDLDNGLRVILIPTSSEGLVTYMSVVRTGSRDEFEPGHTGFAHFFEHMMFRGTERYPSAEYERIVTSIGADANAYTTDDYTCYFLSFGRGDLARVVEIEADRFQNLAYAEREFQTEAGAVYGEYRKGRTSPWWVLEEAILETAFDVHTYRHTTIGFEADIAAMPTMYDYSRSFFSRYYRPENVVILVVGDIDPGETLELVRGHYGEWKSGYVSPTIPTEPEQLAARTAEVRYEGRTLPIVSVGWKSPAFAADDRVAVAGSLLGELAFGETSPAYRRLVLEQRSVQRLRADFGMTRDPGLWTVTAVVASAELVPEVRAALTGAATQLAEAPVEVARLEALKQRTRYQLLLGLDSPDRIAHSLARFVALTGGVDAVERYLGTVAGATVENVHDAARRYLAPERSTTVVLEGVQ